MIIIFKNRFWILCLLLCAGLVSPFQTAFSQSNDQTQQYFEISKNLEILTNLFKELSQSYVNPIQPGKMTKVGINAMLAGLDPYTNFFTEADAENFQLQTQGQYGGIGIVSQLLDSNIVVAQVFQGSPADKAGIHAGDILKAVNGQSLAGKSTDELEVLMLGDKGSSLSLKTQNPVSKRISIIQVTRSVIKISDVPYAGLMGKGKDIAYIRLTQFMGPASEETKRALDSLKKIQPDLKGVVLDLRGNPGGLLKEAVRTCNLFIPEGQTVVTTKGKNEEWKQVFQTTGQPWDTQIPVAVLMNHNSASASEIVAGTMQDLDRGIIIGTNSYGKGLVQQVKPLGFNTSLKLTVAHYYTPSGRCIQALDYAHRNADGSVSKIPDSLRHNFKTRDGRIVKDGGGIQPDIYIPEAEPDAFIQLLNNKGYIFNYATQYYYSHPQIAAAGEFQLSQNDYNQFKNWLQTQDFNQATPTGILLEKFKKETTDEGQYAALQPQFEALKKQVQVADVALLNKDKPKIIDLLSNEIAGRYYYQKGETLNKLSQDDPTLKKAIEILYNKHDYEKILSVKK